MTVCRNSPLPVTLVSAGCCGGSAGFGWLAGALAAARDGGSSRASSFCSSVRRPSTSTRLSWVLGLSAAESMNRRISQGQAIRSVFGRARVIHFMTPPQAWSAGGGDGSCMVSAGRLR